DHGAFAAGTKPEPMWIGHRKAIAYQGAQQRVPRGREVVVGTGAVDDAVDDGMRQVHSATRAPAYGDAGRFQLQRLEPAGVHMQLAGLAQVRQPGERRLRESMSMHVPVRSRMPQEL